MCLNPLGIGEGFEQETQMKNLTPHGLNPLGIGEGFERQAKISLLTIPRLNPLGIGEGFEPKRVAKCVKSVVLIP